MSELKKIYSKLDELKKDRAQLKINYRGGSVAETEYRQNLIMLNFTIQTLSEFLQ